MAIIHRSGTREIARGLIEPIPAFYPYILGEPRPEHQLVLIVNEAVPRGLHESTRADICQDLLVAILDNQIEVEDLPQAVPEFIKRHFRQFPTKYGPISLDAKPPWGDEDSRTLAETISEDNIRQHW